MNKAKYLVILVALILASCDPLEDINKALDEARAEFGYSNSFERTLSPDDYAAIADLAREMGTSEDSLNADFIENNEYFSADVSASTYVPGFLTDEYPALNVSSVGVITYQYYANYPEYLSELKGPESYALSDSDYLSIGEQEGLYKTLIGSDKADDYVPGILADKINSPAEGDVMLVTYKYTGVIEDPSVTKTLESSDYQLIVDYVKDNIDTSYIGDYGDTESFFGADAYHKDFYSSAGGWEDTAFASAEEAEITALRDVWLPGTYPDAQPEVEGKTVYYNLNYHTYDGTHYYPYIVFECTAAGSPPTFALVEGPSESELNYSTTTTADMGAYYQYSGTEWEAMENVYYLSSEDYNSMGSPGKYDNFSSSDSPDDYLPQLLASRYPYAQDGDVMAVAYKYYSGGVSVLCDEYSFSGGWTAYNPLIDKTDQFIQNGQKWVFDPTVTITMASADYQIIVDYVKNNIDASYVDTYGTAESYFGASAYYSDFDAGSFEETEFDTWEDAAAEAIGGVLLPARFPDAVTQVDGVDVYYIVNFVTYSGTAGNYKIKFQVTKSGPNPEFTLVEGPTTR